MLRLALRPNTPLLAAARLRLRPRARDARARATATGASTKSADAEGIAADDEKFMRLALREATLAAHALEVPVGAVLVEHATGAVLASHHNSTLREEDPTAHAELKCIREGAKKLGSWRRLAETTLYVTLEPCPMCAGGVLNARLGAVVWGAPNPLIGADGSWIDLMGDGGTGCGAEGVCETEETEADEDTIGSFRRGAPPAHAFKPSLAVRRRVLEEECGEVIARVLQEQARGEQKRASGEDARARRASRESTGSAGCFRLSTRTSRGSTRSRRQVPTGAPVSAAGSWISSPGPAVAPCACPARLPHRCSSPRRSGTSRTPGPRTWRWR